MLSGGQCATKNDFSKISMSGDLAKCDDEPLSMKQLVSFSQSAISIAFGYEIQTNNLGSFRYRNITKPMEK